jgi:cyclohexyl-isocyanide hydratase
MRHAGFIAFPNVTQLDLTGPLQVLSRLPGWKTHVVASSLEPVPTDCGFALVPTQTFESCPPLDLVCVPGGFGVDDALCDGVTVPFLERAGARAQHATSVCTGAFLLGAAGLLRGRRATTHWAYREALSRVGAVPVDARVVRDGPILTGGGVTAGIDFGLALAAELAGREVAERIQLALEYDPAPPFHAGRPEQAPEAVRAEVRATFGRRRAVFEARLAAALEALGPRG